MAQHKPKEHHVEEERPPEMDEEARERIRNDPNVIVHHQKTTEPYVPKIVLKEPVDVLWLIGRRKTEWVDDEDYPSAGVTEHDVDSGAEELKGGHAMAESKRAETHEEIDDVWLEQLRNDPDVIIRRGSGKPFVSELKVTKGLDVLELLGRRGNDEDDDESGCG